MKTFNMGTALAVLFFSAVSFAQALDWIDASASNSVEVDGLPWFEGNGGKFIRLPQSRQTDIENGTDLYVWGNSQYPSTARIRFKTDSTSLHLKIDHGGARLAMYHMASIAVSGIDLYIGEPGSESFWKVSNPKQSTGEYEHVFFDGMDSEMREFTLYLPTYSKLVSLKIGIDAGATITRPTPYEKIKPIVSYGTSITQGACSSRCSNGYVAQLGRRLNCDMVNLGFSGSAHCEPIMAEMLLEIDASIYLIDCVANMDATLMNARYETFVNTIRSAKPDVPIVLMTKNHYAKEIVEGPDFYNDQHEALYTTYSNRLAAGDQNIHLFDTGALIPTGGDHPSADGTHLTDEGFTRIADGLEPVLEQIFQGLETPPPTYVSIGDTNNVADTTGYGAVGYAYKIAQNAVTIEQFYYSGVGDIDQNYWNDGTHMVGWDAPATVLTWNEAAKYCNWLTSGNPTNGAYQFDATGNTLTAVDRDAALATYGTVYAIPTEDEWYKAAYYTGSGYSLYPFGVDTPPLGGTNANPQANIKEGTYVNASPNYAWKVGSGAMEQNGTYDMVGNAFEWIESAADGTLDDMAENRVMRGGSWYYDDYYARSTTRTPRDPSAPSSAIEFRPVQLGLTPLEAWAADYGLSGTNATATADPDGDALDNLGEYGLGGDPTNPADQGIPPTYAMDEAGGSNWVTYVYPKRSNLNSGLTYYLEISTNLVSGTWINDGYSVVGTGTIDPEFNAVTNQIPAEPEREKFVRLVIEG